MTAAWWQDACTAARIFAVDPVGLGGVALRAAAGPARDAWLAVLRGSLPEGAAVRRVPLRIADERLLGGLDLAATLRAGRPIAERGVLAETDGGVLLLAMAERIEPGTVARIAGVLDAGEVVLERDGLTRRYPCALGVVLLDEGIEADERPHPALLDRCAFLLELPPMAGPPDEALRVTAARASLPQVAVADTTLTALADIAAVLGVASTRALLMALRAARAAAALDGRLSVSAADVTLAARLVLSPRATMLPPPPDQAAEDEEQPDQEPSPTEEPATGRDQESTDQESAGAVDDLVLAAAIAAIPPGLLAELQAGQRASGKPAAGRTGAVQQSPRRGRPIGTRRGALGGGARLNVVATLRAAAPWQRIRRAQLPEAQAQIQARVLVRPDDFRVTRYQQRTESTVIFVVDASGSAALNRLAEAKGAVELLLADCYVRRDQVALLSFRGPAATLLLPPTNSLVRAKRGLAGLAGGGGTPLASALDQAAALAIGVRRRGPTPLIVLLTDGRANIARDGTPGRQQAAKDANDAACAIRAAGLSALLIDTSPSPKPEGQALATAMAARYLPLPYADSAALSAAVRAT